MNKNKWPRVQTMFRLPNGNETTDSKIIFEKLNGFFINTGPTLPKYIPGMDMYPVYPMGNKWKETLFLSRVDVPGITSVTMSLKNSAVVFYEIDATSFKFDVTWFAQPICCMCNLCWREGIFELSATNLVRLYKTDDFMVFNFYYPYPYCVPHQRSWSRLYRRYFYISPTNLIFYTDSSLDLERIAYSIWHFWH